MRWATLIFDHDPDLALEPFYWSDDPHRSSSYDIFISREHIYWSSFLRSSTGSRERGVFEEWMKKNFQLTRDDITGQYGFWRNPNQQFQSCSLGGAFQSVLALLPTPEKPRRSTWDPLSGKLIDLPGFTVQAKVDEIDWSSVDFSKIGAFIWKGAWCAGVAAIDGMATPTQALTSCLRESITQLLSRISGDLTVSIYDCFLDF